MKLRCIAIVAMLLAAPSASKAQLSGSGTPGDPYLIATDANLASFVSSVNADASGDGASTKVYKITADVSASGTSQITVTFKGTLTAQAKGDGTFPVISGLRHPLFTTLSSATVSNIMLKDVAISQAGSVGAICCTATVATRIYNCGILPTDAANTTPSTVASTDGYCGGLVGYLDGTVDATNNARVINCFSFANITGGTDKAGIVGYNTYNSKTGSIRTMVMNCMFYGDISSGGKISPIYGGLDISNRVNNNGKLNNYNYFLFESDFSQSGRITDYNHALAAEERFLVRFEFYRYLLNSTRELAAYYVDPNPITTVSTNSTEAHKRYHADLMAKWVLDKSIAPYPILKAQGYYPSVVNYDPDNTFDSQTHTSVARNTVTAANKGKHLGTLTVKIKAASDWTNKPTGAALNDASYTSTGLTLNITDMDFDDYNFNYGKVQLPYYSEVGTGNCTKNKVVTGWKIVAVEGGTEGTYTASNEWGGYNFADRSTYAKDLYSNSGRVFSQGAYYDVPDGVTSITIEPYWGTAAYLSDAYFDSYGYASSASKDKNGVIIFQGVTDFGRRYENKKTYNICGDDQMVYTYLADALSSLSGSTVYDNALVLVGNFHQQNIGSNSKKYTVMSADFDNDREPDFSFIYNSGKQQAIDPIRFDFVNVPGTAIAHKLKGGTEEGTYMGIMGNHKWKGWLEVTNTCFIRFSQLEYDSELKSGSSPVILLGGVVEQMVSTNGKDGEQGHLDGYVTHTSYIHVGGNAWFKLFNNGCHIDKTKTKTPRIPISVTGGEYEKFYLSGYFRPDAPAHADDAECYVSGGHFGELAGAGQELIDGDVTWDINHADIDDFYGGGINEKKPITGDITVTINNSRVGRYCGGPKFGNMASGKTVVTNATGCTFGNYYGAGYGGTALVRQNTFNEFGKIDYPWNSSIATTFTASNGANKRGKLDDGLGGFAISYEYEHFEGSNDKTVGRFYVNYASLSIAQVNNVTSNLTGCTVTGNFYGGGSLGKVAGDATSTLTGCTVLGNVYGAGYSATVPKAAVYRNAGFQTEPNYNTLTGVFKKGVPAVLDSFVWVESSSPAFNDTDKTLGTKVKFSDLGRVTGRVILTIDGATNVSGSVFGGGEMSGVTGTTTVDVKGSGTITNHVFGGGDKGSVSGATTVTLGALDASSNSTSTVTVSGDIYGGGNLANVGTSVADSTRVFVLSGTVAGSVYGGGRGDIERSEEPEVNGLVHVYIGRKKGDGAEGAATIGKYVFGGNNMKGSPKRDVKVDIWKTAHTNANEVDHETTFTSFETFKSEVESPSSDWHKPAAFAIQAVYGGGNKAAYVPTATSLYSSQVWIHNCDNTVKMVYGGGRSANVGYEGASAADRILTDVNVIVDGGRIDTLFGGGDGHILTNPASPWNASSNPYLAADIIGNATSEITGGFYTAAFSGSNTAGDILHGTKSLAVGNSTCGTTEYILSLFGGSNEAETHGNVVLTVRCGVGDIKELYGGSNKANIIDGNVTLNVIGGNFDYVYGGSKGTDDISADIHGDVTLNLHGGTITEAAFGGSNKKGNIYGKITVNVNDTSTQCPLVLNDVYGAGNLASYTPDHDASGNVITSPEVNITHFRSTASITGSVYGGGKGATAVVTANPRVTIGDAVIVEDVFGGGDQAKVLGNTTVRVTEASSRARDVFGGGNEADVVGTTTVGMINGQVARLFGGGNKAGVGHAVAAVVTGGDATVTMSGGRVTGGIYGGCHESDTVYGVIAVNVNGGQVGTDALSADVFGGGLGQATMTANSVEVVVGNSTGTPKVYGDVYGGSALGQVNSAPVAPVTTPSANTSCHTYVTLKKGTVDGNIYGGGLGQTAPSIEAKVWSPVTVTVSGGTVDSVFGCNNLNGAPQSDVNVTVSGNGTVKQSVFGGGNQAAYGGSPVVTVKESGKVIYNVYGGGNKAEVGGNTSVKLQGNADIGGNVFGGGNEGPVVGTSSVEIKDPTPEP